MSVKPCPFDPMTLAGKPIGQLHCPECGCQIVAGMFHGPCIDSECPYYDVEAAQAFDISYAEWAKQDQRRLTRLLGKCHRCTDMRERIGEKQMAEIVFHLTGVLKDRAIHRWFHTWNSKLQSTPILALEQARVPEVLALTRGYEDPGFV